MKERSNGDLINKMAEIFILGLSEATVARADGTVPTFKVASNLDK